MGEIAQAAAAIFRRSGHAEEAERPHLLPQIHRKLILAVDFRSQGRNLFLREALYGLSQRLGLLAETEFHS